MGVTFLEYQNEYRLSFIYKDLINTKAPVHVILERHGFTNYKLFRRMFQEHFGVHTYEGTGEYEEINFLKYQNFRELDNILPEVLLSIVPVHWSQSHAYTSRNSFSYNAS